MNREPRQGTAQDMENTLIGLNRRLAKAEAALEAVAMSPNPICTGETGHPKPCDCVGDIVRAALRRDVCGIAPVAITSTNEATHRTAKAALPTEGHLLLEWESLSAESQNKVSKWFQLAMEHLQGILDAPAISRPPTQGFALPPSRADLGGDRTDALVERITRIFYESEQFHRPYEGHCNCGFCIWDSGHVLAMTKLDVIAALKTDRAVAEGQQSSELVEKTPSASPGERE